MILSQGILDELRHQAELQGKKNYRCIEVDWRTIVAICDEIEVRRNGIAGCMETIESPPNAVIANQFARGERVVYCGKEYEFLDYTVDGVLCFLNPLGRANANDSFTVVACHVRKAPL